MTLFDFNLPTRYRLRVTVVKRRKNLDEKPLFPSLGRVLRSKNPNKLSVFFRYIFENEKVKKILGTNLALLLLTSSLIPSEKAFVEAEEINEIQTPFVFVTQSAVQYPVKSIKITTTFRFYHPGIDLDGKTGDEVKPIMKGKVEAIEYSRFGYGNSVLIQHGNNIRSLYAHLSKIHVKKDQEVTNETKIGEMGATGRAFGDHLHLEIHEEGRAINPLIILPK